MAEVLSGDFLDVLRTNGFSPLGYGPAHFAECLAEDRARWGHVVREAHITIEG